MNQAFLLRTIEGVIDGVKIRHKDTLEPTECRLGHLTFAALGIEVSHLVHIGENPNVSFRALDTDVRFVGMHQVSRQDPLQNLSMGLAVVRSEILLPLCDGCRNSVAIPTTCPILVRRFELEYKVR